MFKLLLDTTFVGTTWQKITKLFLQQFFVAEQEAFQKEKLTEEYNDAYPFNKQTILILIFRLATIPIVLLCFFNFALLLFVDSRFLNSLMVHTVYDLKWLIFLDYILFIGVNVTRLFNTKFLSS